MGSAVWERLIPVRVQPCLREPSSEKVQLEFRHPASEHKVREIQEHPSVWQATKAPAGLS